MSKTLRSAYISDSAYTTLQELARYRSLIRGDKNSLGQNIGVCTLINEAVVKYADEHMPELEKYRDLMRCLFDKKGVLNGEL